MVWRGLRSLDRALSLSSTDNGPTGARAARHSSHARMHRAANREKVMRKQTPMPNAARGNPMARKAKALKASRLPRKRHAPNPVSIPNSQLIPHTTMSLVLCPLQVGQSGRPVVTKKVGGGGKNLIHSTPFCPPTPPGWPQVRRAAGFRRPERRHFGPPNGGKMPFRTPPGRYLRRPR